MTEGRLKHFGWGREGEGLTAEEEAAALDRYRRLFTVDRFDELQPAVAVGDRAAAAAPRSARRPGALLLERTLRSGRAHLRQVLFGLRARTRSVITTTRPMSSPTRATKPRSAAVLDWAGGAQAALIPFGGGSSVVGGVEPRRRRHRVQGGDHPRSAAPGPRAGDRPHLARRAHRGRRLWPRARGPAQAA